MLTTSSFMSEAYDTLQRNQNRSTQIILNERNGSYGGVFDRDILDEEGETKETFVKRQGETVIIRLDGIVWVENLSIGNFTLTDQRIFYQPVYYDLPMTTKNLEINLDNISAIGHWLVPAASGIVLFAGNSNAKVEFVSKVPFKMIKTWKALKHINKRWKYLDPNKISKMQQSGFLKGLKIATGATIGVVAVTGAVIGGLALVGKFLSGKAAVATQA